MVRIRLFGWRVEMASKSHMVPGHPDQLAQQSRWWIRVFDWPIEVGLCSGCLEELSGCAWSVQTAKDQQWWLRHGLAAAVRQGHLVGCRLVSKFIWEFLWFCFAYFVCASCYKG